MATGRERESLLRGIRSDVQLGRRNINGKIEAV